LNEDRRPHDRFTPNIKKLKDGSRVGKSVRDRAPTLMDASLGFGSRPSFAYTIRRSTGSSRSCDCGYKAVAACPAVDDTKTFAEDDPTLDPYGLRMTPTSSRGRPGHGSEGYVTRSRDVTEVGVQLLIHHPLRSVTPTR
jgi:hypothetical protein